MYIKELCSSASHIVHSLENSTKVSGYLEHILKQREIESPNRTHAYIYFNRAMKVVVHDSSKRYMFLAALSRHSVRSRDKISLHFAQHKGV